MLGKQLLVLVLVLVLGFYDRFGLPSNERDPLRIIYCLFLCFRCFGLVVVAFTAVPQSE